MGNATGMQWGIALLLLTGTACGPAAGRSGQNVRDSAGVVLVEHGAELPSGVARWSVEPTPVLDVGGSEQEEAYLFTRIAHAGVLPEGSLLIADWGTRDLRVFDSSGRFLRRIGRSGGGPGEFRQLTMVDVDHSGRIAVYDGILRRVSWFSGDGTLLEAIAVPSSPGGATAGHVLGRFGDGSLLVQSVVGVSGQQSLPSPGIRQVRDSNGLFLVSPNGSSISAIGRFPASRQIRAVGRVIALDPAPFGVQTVIAIADTTFYLSTQEHYEVREFRLDGSLKRVLRRMVPARPVTDDARAQMRRERDARAERLASGRPVPPELVELARYSETPDFFPAHGDLRVDRAGNLWVEDYRPFPDRDTVTTWTVFGADGAILSTATLPRIQITEIGADYVVGVRRDDDGVPSVRVYRIAR
jgi:hypothetical protein